MLRPLLVALLISVSAQLPGAADHSVATAADAELWTLGDLDALKAAPKMHWLDSESPIRSLTYRNEPFNGMPTDVFAFYATPGSVSGNAKLDKDLPAVVLIHGGGGTAFAEWVWLWAKRGYAAIAMDLSGRRASAPEFDPQTRELNVVRNHRDIIRTRLLHGGPEADHLSKFTNSGGDLSDDWQIHAVAAVIRAHSLIRSFPEVDAELTAVTGISWGGYLTSDRVDRQPLQSRRARLRLRVSLRRRVRPAITDRRAAGGAASRLDSALRPVCLAAKVPRPDPLRKRHER
jgi:dienelactone hydrolase